MQKVTQPSFAAYHPLVLFSLLFYMQKVTQPPQLHPTSQLHPECIFFRIRHQLPRTRSGRLILPPLKTPTRRKRGMPPHRHDGDPCGSPDVHSHRLLGRVVPGSEGGLPAGRPPMSHWRRHDTYVTSAAAWRRVPVEAQVVLARVGVVLHGDQ